MDQSQDQTSAVRQPITLSDLASQDAEEAKNLEIKIDRCLKMIKEMDEDIAALMRSQDYYHKRMRSLAKRRCIKLNLRLL